MYKVKFGYSEFKGFLLVEVFIEKVWQYKLDLFGICTTVAETWAYTYKPNYSSDLRCWETFYVLIDIPAFYSVPPSIDIPSDAVILIRFDSFIGSRYFGTYRCHKLRTRQLGL